MYAVIGTFCLALAILGFTVVMLSARKPNPPAWAKHALTHEISALGSVALAGFGIGFVIQSALLFKQQPLTATQVVLVAAIVVVFIFAWARLKARKTLAEYARQTESAPRPANVRPSVVGMSPASGTSGPENPSTPTRPRTPSRPKKAA